MSAGSWRTIHRKQDVILKFDFALAIRQLKRRISFYQRECQPQ
jgi:hypothetical protein